MKLKKTLESPLDIKDLKPVNPKRNKLIDIGNKLVITSGKEKEGRGKAGVGEELPTTMYKINKDFPCSPVDKILSSQCRGPEFNPWSGN